ncbi:aldo/keto reductase [Thermodesulfobacteriota bacterium]
MRYRSLGNCGLKVSEIGLGGNTFNDKLGEKKSISIIHHALDKGINFIDTADVYGKGRSEELIGKAIQDKRSKVIIATKFSGAMGAEPNESGASRHYMLRAVDASLKRLKTGYIDLYYLHRPDLTTPIEETLRTLNDLIRSGKVRYIGCSNMPAWKLCEAQWVSKVNHLEPFIVVQSQYNLLNRTIESELVPCCQKYQIGVIPWSPLGGGFLTGKYKRDKTQIPGARLSDPQFPGSNILSETNFEKLDKLHAFAEECGHNVQELAIAWLLAQPWISSIIAGATKPDQISANIAAAEWKLSQGEIDQLNGL